MKKLLLSIISIVAIGLLATLSGFAYTDWTGCNTCHPTTVGTGLHSIAAHTSCSICHPGGTIGKNVAPSSCIVCHPASGSGLCPLINTQPAHGNTCLVCHANCTNSPSCVSVNPQSAYQGQTLDVTIIGWNTNFIDTGSSVNSTTVSFGCTGITVNSTTVSSPTEVTANITIAPVAQPCIGDVTVTTGDEVVTCEMAFSINGGGGECPTDYPVDCGNGYCCPSDYPVCGTGTNTGMCGTELPPPANDDFANATPIRALPFTDTINTSEATPATDDPTDCYGTNANVWYELTSITNIRIQVDTSYSNYDTVVAVYTGTRGNLNLVACSDYPCLTLDVRAGETYYFMVTSYYGMGGNLVFSVDVAPPPPPPLTIDLQIDAVNFVKNGITTVSGTVNSSVPLDAFVSVQVRQKAGRVFITGYNNTYVYTADGVAHWTMQVSGDIGPFLSGKATVRAIAQGCTYYDRCGYYSECAQTPEVAETVQLKPSHPTTTTSVSTTTTVPVTSTSVPSTTTISIPPDRDGDGVPDAIDNCPDNCNTMQLDADMDGIGDVCDKNPGCGKGKKPACEQQC